MKTTYVTSYVHLHEGNVMCMLRGFITCDKVLADNIKLQNLLIIKL